MDAPKSPTPLTTPADLDAMIHELRTSRLNHAEKLNLLATEFRDLHTRVALTESNLTRLNERLTAILASLGQTN